MLGYKNKGLQVDISITAMKEFLYCALSVKIIAYVMSSSCILEGATRARHSALPSMTWTKYITHSGRSLTRRYILRWFRLIAKQNTSSPARAINVLCLHVQQTAPCLFESALYNICVYAAIKETGAVISQINYSIVQRGYGCVLLLYYFGSLISMLMRL